MYKTFFLATTLCALLATSCDVRKKDKIAAPAPQPVQKRDLSNPTTVQLLDSVYDFGTIKEGDTVVHIFRFKNTGNKPLVINNASASCGCTVADKPEAPIAPGEIGTIKAKFNSKGKPGQAEKTITVTSNADPEFSKLLIKGTVIGKTD